MRGSQGIGMILKSFDWSSRKRFRPLLVRLEAMATIAICKVFCVSSVEALVVHMVTSSGWIVRRAGRVWLRAIWPAGLSIHEIGGGTELRLVKCPGLEGERR